MPETTEESELHNGHQPQAEPEPESKAESQPESKTEPGPENKPEEALKVEPVVTGADPNTKEEDKESSIQPNDAAKPSSTDQNARPQLRKDEGNRTFTMRELLTEFKSDEEEAGSPYRYIFCFFFRSGFSIEQATTLFYFIIGFSEIINVEIFGSVEFSVDPSP